MLKKLGHSDGILEFEQSPFWRRTLSEELLLVEVGAQLSVSAYMNAIKLRPALRRELLQRTRICYIPIFVCIGLLFQRIWCFLRQSTKATPSVGTSIHTFVAHDGTGIVDSRVVKVKGGEPFGRLGNKVEVAFKMLRHGLLSGCHVQLPADLLAGWDPGFKLLFNRYADTSNGTTLCKQLSAREWFFHEDETPDPLVADQSLFIKSISAHRNTYKEFITKSLRSALNLYFASNATHSFGKPCKDGLTFAIHIRGGDTTSGHYSRDHGNFVPSEPDAHTLYGPYPTSYFLSVLHLALQLRYSVVIFCEDLSSPTCELFDKIGLLWENVHVRVGRPLVEDLHEMNCAQHVAFSFGTFRSAMLLRERPTCVHDFVFHKPEDNTCAPSCSFFHYFRQPTEASQYIDDIRSNN